MANIVIGPNTIISSDTTYNGDHLDLMNGNIIVKNNAVLTIENCTLDGELSDMNPTLFSILLGKLVVKDSVFHTFSPTIAPHPHTQSLHYVIRCEQAKIDLQGSDFHNHHNFTVGFFITSDTIPTSDIFIQDNLIKSFHGGIYLLNTNNALVNDNILSLNSYGNMVLIGSDSVISNNAMYFSGIDELGNAIDIIHSNNVNIHHNNVFTPTCRGIYIFASENVMINDNSITGGITYGIILQSSVGMLGKDDYAISFSKKKTFGPILTSHIKIFDNVLSQNRYGLAATDVDDLMVNGNFFSQRFDNASNRKFWTDNTNLLINVTNLIWNDNKYKEAFTQQIDGDNSNTFFVDFPMTGGVVL